MKRNRLSNNVNKVAALAGSILCTDNVDKVAALAGIVLSALLLAYELVSHTRNPNVILVALLVAALCAIWVRVRNLDTLKNVELSNEKWLWVRNIDTLKNVERLSNEKLFWLISGFFFLFFGCSVLSLHLRPEVYVRPIAYFIFTALMASAVGAEVVISISNWTCRSVILAQSAIIGFSLQASELLIYPNVVGIDPWNYQWFVSQTLLLGHIAAGSQYTNLPMFPLYVAATSLLSSLDYKLSVMLSVGLSLVVVGALFVFLIGKSLVSEKVGLLGALLFVIANNIIYFGYWTIPNTLGATYLLIGIYLVVQLKGRNPIRSLALLLIVMGSLILAHTLSALAMTLVLFSGLFATLLYRRFYGREAQTYLSFTIAATFAVAMLLWWTYGSGSLALLVGHLQNLELAPLQAASSATVVNQSLVERIFDFVGSTSFVALSLMGCFYLVSKKFGNARTFVFVFMALPLAFLAFSQFSGLYLLSDRWLALAQEILAVSFGVNAVAFRSARAR